MITLFPLDRSLVQNQRQFVGCEKCYLWHLNLHLTIDLGPSRLLGRPLPEVSAATKHDKNYDGSAAAC